jgi:hypothetical protein
VSGVIWQYPPEIMAKVLARLPEHVREANRIALAERHAETLGRIDARIAETVALQKERIAALEWCRANGNPHRKEDVT